MAERLLKVSRMASLSVKRLVFITVLLALCAAAYLKLGNVGVSDTPAAEPAAKGAGKGGKGFAKGGATKGGGGPVNVTVATVEQKSVPVRVDGIGNVEAFTTVQIKVRVDGQIVDVNFKEGQEVEEGTGTAVLDPRPYEAALKQAEAAVARDRATLERARAQEARYKDLLEKKFVSPDGYAQILTNAQTAEAVAQSTEAAVENARVQMDYTTIRSPVDGYVGKVMLQRGNIARAADPNAIAVVDQVHPIYVSFAVPEKYLADIRAAARICPGPARVGFPHGIATSFRLRSAMRSFSH